MLRNRLIYFATKLLGRYSARALRLLGFVALSLLVLLLGLWRSGQSPSPEPMRFAGMSSPQANGHQALQGLPTEDVELVERTRHRIPMPFFAVAAHASYLLQKGDELQAFWFAGQRESGADVRIVQSTLDLKSAEAQWTTAQIVVDRHHVCEGLSGQLGGLKPLNGCPIRRIGNPVAWVDGQGRTHLYVVATTYLGGWAASRILHLVQEGVGAAFKAKNFLPLSPLFNISHLVRTSPIALADGGALLPIYFELGIKYPLTVRLDKNGDMVQRRAAVTPIQSPLQYGAPLDWTLQPALVATSDNTAFAYLRDNTEQRHLRIAKTDNAGTSWTPVQREGVVINPDSSVGAVQMPNKSIALIHNPQASGRHRLVIEASKDGVNGWRKLATLEYEPPERNDVVFNEYSYPSALVIGDQLHVSYTYQRRYINHVVFQIKAKTPREAQ